MSILNIYENLYLQDHYKKKYKRQNNRKGAIPDEIAPFY